MRWFNTTVELIIVAWAGWAVIQSQRRPKTVTRRASPALRRSVRPASPPLVTRLGRACGRVYVAWLEGWREAQPLPPRPLPPQLTVDIVEVVEVFRAQREAVAAMPYVTPPDPLLERLVLTNEGTPPKQPEQLPDVMIRAAVDAGYKADAIAQVIKLRRQDVYRLVKEAKAA